MIKFLEEGEELAKELVPRRQLKGLFLESVLRSLQEVLTMKLQSIKQNGMTCMLLSHLYELMPETLEQQ